MATGPAVQSVDRAIDLLETMADLGGDATLSDLASASQLPMPTIHRLLRTLVHRGYARQLPSRRYGLGPRLARLGEVSARQFGAGTRANLERLAGELGESVNLALRDGDRAIYVAQASSAQQMRMFTEVGRRVHCHCTGVGKAILAQLPDATITEIAGRSGLPPQTERTITTVPALMAEIGTIRQQGYAIDDGEQEIGVRCFAVPVPGAPVSAALSVSGPAVRVHDDFGQAALPRLHEVAEVIASDLT